MMMHDHKKYIVLKHLVVSDKSKLDLSKKQWLHDENSNEVIFNNSKRTIEHCKSEIVGYDVM